VVAVYWSPERVETGLPREAVFLGSAWGPAELPMALPDAAKAAAPGVLYFLSLSGEQKLLAVVPLATK
jgi:hypothetical protein